MKNLDKKTFFISKIIPTLIFISILFFKQSENIFKNLALNRYVDRKDFENLFDGNLAGKEKEVEVRFPIQIFLEADYYVKEIFIYKIKKSEERKRLGILNIYLNNLNTICGTCGWPDFYRKKVKVTCFREIKSSVIFFQVKNQNLNISEIEVYGLLIENSSSPYLFPTGCFKQNSIPVLNSTKFFSMEKCFLFCRKLHLRYIALNLFKCGCLKEKPLQQNSNLGICEKNCPGSLYFCGKDGSFRVIEDKNLCNDYSTNPCNKKISYCVHNLTDVKCFCTKNNKKINFYSQSSACGIPTFFKKKGFPKKKKKKINGNKTIIIGPAFPPKLKFDVEVNNITRLKFSPGCYSNLTSCVVTLHVQGQIFCPEKFKNRTFEQLLNKNENFIIIFKNESKEKSGFIQCKMEFIAEEPIKGKSRSADLMKIIYDDTDFQEESWFDYIAMILILWTMVTLVIFLLFFFFSGEKEYKVYKEYKE